MAQSVAEVIAGDTYTTTIQRTRYSKQFTYFSNERPGLIDQLLEQIRTNPPTEDPNYHAFIKSIIRYEHRWGKFSQWTRQEFEHYVETHNIDYRCHGYMKRNICLRIYDDDGRLVTAEDLIKMYHSGISTINRTLQKRNRGRVFEFEYVRYDIDNPTIWRAMCQREGLYN